MNVFQELALSIYSYGSYSQFLKNKKGKVIGFGVLLATIYFLLTMIVPEAIHAAGSAGVIQSLQESIPDFELEDGRLWVEESVDIKSGLNYIYVNTDEDLQPDKVQEILADWRGNVLLLDSEKVIIRNQGQVQQMYFSDMGLELDREDLVQFLPLLYVFYAVFLIFAYVWMVGLFFFGVLFVALLGMIVASCMKYDLTFGQLYQIGIYSRTLPLLIKALVSFLPFGIPFFGVINFGLSLLILGLAIQKMKTAAC